MTNYKNLAVKYEGRVRFAYVAINEEELLGASFDVKGLPHTIFIKDGTAYWYRDFPYESIMTKYIDNQGYFKSTTKFNQPARFTLTKM